MYQGWIACMSRALARGSDRRSFAVALALYRTCVGCSAVPQPERQPESAPQTDRGFLERMSAITGLTGTALIVYLIISEGSRLVRHPVPDPGLLVSTV